MVIDRVVHPEIIIIRQMTLLVCAAHKNVKNAIHPKQTVKEATMMATESLPKRVIRLKPAYRGRLFRESASSRLRRPLVTLVSALDLCITSIDASETSIAESCLTIHCDRFAGRTSLTLVAVPPGSYLFTHKVYVLSSKCG
jgi:hypothetical protein